MSVVKHWIKACGQFMLPLVPALAIATPSLAAEPINLNDPTEPGSVIVFPKWVSGTQLVDGVRLPSTEIEVGVVCPRGATCAEHQAVKLRFHWVCPGFEDLTSKFICRENNFDVFASVNGKVVFNPENITITGSNAVNVPRPPCPNLGAGPPTGPGMGYLIGWVINPANDLPIKFDGLVGDGVIRETPTSLASYSAIPIQADPALATLAGITLAAGGRLPFTGLAGQYAAVTGTVIGDVRFDNPTVSTGFPIAGQTFLTLLTLDVLSDLPNYPVEVNINWWNEHNAQSPTNVLSEKLLSTSFEFICWTEVPLTTIDPNLTQTQMGSRKGVFRSTRAEKFPILGIADTAGPVTLLGLIETTEAGLSRVTFSNTFNNSDPVPTFFLPE